MDNLKDAIYDLSKEKQDKTPCIYFLILRRTFSFVVFFCSVIAKLDTESSILFGDT